MSQMPPKPKFDNRVISTADLLEPDNISSRLIVGPYLGGGAFSEVYQGKLLATGETVAIKVVDRSICSGKDYMIRSEVRILQKAKHPNVIGLKDIFETSENVYIVMDFVAGGDAFERISAKGRLSPEEVATAMVDLLRGIGYLHSLGITHRDLKLENLLYDTDELDSLVKIADFGLSSSASKTSMLMTTACGTPGYVAPEVLKRQGYNSKADLWSAGVVAYTMLCGYPPFYEETNAELFKQISAGNYSFDSPYWDDIPTLAQSFVSGLLKVNVGERMSVAESLRHDFLHRYAHRDLSNERANKVDDSAAPGRGHELAASSGTLGTSVETIVESKTNLVLPTAKPVPPVASAMPVTAVGAIHAPLT